LGKGIRAEDMTALRWVKPRIVVEVSFVEWTREGLLRHPEFVWRARRQAPREVRRDAPGHVRGALKNSSVPAKGNELCQDFTPADGVDLIDEQDAGCVLLALLEQVADAGCPTPTSISTKSAPLIETTGTSVVGHL
jgi:hypothetical protein